MYPGKLTINSGQTVWSGFPGGNKSVPKTVAADFTVAKSNWGIGDGIKVEGQFWLWAQFCHGGEFGYADTEPEGQF